MRRKTLSVLFALGSVVSCTFGLASCGTDASVITTTVTAVAPDTSKTEAETTTVTETTRITTEDLTDESKKSYIVSMNPNNGNSMESVLVLEGDSLPLEYKTVKDGYTFDGWYYYNGVKYENEPIMKDTRLEAHYVSNTYTVTLDTDGSTHTVTYGESFVLPEGVYQDSSKEYVLSYDFLGWSYEGNLLTDEEGNSLNNWSIAEDVTLHGEFGDSSTLYFGSYPQSLATEEESNKLSYITFDSSVWTDYEYYIENAKAEFMYYLDVDVDSDGAYDYRGVYFTSYRPYDTTISSKAENSSSYDNGYRTDTIYWFRYEPIAWSVLKTEDDKALILSDMLLDSRDYYHTRDQRIINDETIYSNNYMHSGIRNFLNETFYGQAFNETEKAIVNTKKITNSALSTGDDPNEFACENTEDDVFLLSYEEVATYFEENEDRFCKTTDYAQIQGGFTSVTESFEGNGKWLLRSPYYHSDGTVRGVTDFGRFVDFYVYDTFCGIRTACWITL